MLFNVRRLVALDIGLHGPKFILTEFGLGVPVAMVLGAYLIIQGLLVLGVYIITVGVNYVPLLIYAVILRNDHANVVDMKDPETRRLTRNYSVQQFLIFIPFFIAGLAVLQWPRET